jgi:NADH dehydrogenase [ubiquinone] 1 alpha subcomplex assembly factor 7
MPLARYMTLCLSHPTQGYYTARGADVFGKEGDFITSPEISQTFGEVSLALSRCSSSGSRHETPTSTRAFELGTNAPRGNRAVLTSLLTVLSPLDPSLLGS